MDSSRRNLVLVIVAVAAVAAAVALFLMIDRAPSDAEREPGRNPTGPRQYRPPPRRGPIPARLGDGGWHPHPDRVGLPPAQPPGAQPPGAPSPSAPPDSPAQ